MFINPGGPGDMAPLQDARFDRTRRSFDGRESRDQGPCPRNGLLHTLRT
jgi:hypothetical protein